MKALLVTEHYLTDEVGGAQKSVQFLCEGLALHGLKVVVCALHDHPEIEVSEVNGVRVYKIPLPAHSKKLRDPHLGKAKALRNHVTDFFNQVPATYFRDILIREEPDIVHTNILAGFSSGVWKECTKRKIKVVHTIRDYDLRCARSTMYKHGSKCMTQCIECQILCFDKKRRTGEVNAVVGISHKILRDHLSTGYFMNASHSAMIPNSIGMNLGDSPQSRPSPSGMITLGFIGRLVESKGIEVLLQEMKSLDSDRFKLLVAGTADQKYFEHLKSLAGSNVEFLGRVEAGSFYAEIDLLVVPSVWDEPFGRVVVEGFAAGVPVICSNMGALPELLEGTGAGFVFDPFLTGDLGEKVNMVFAQPETYPRCSEAALEAAGHYTNEAVTGAYLDIYNKLTGS